MFDSPKAIVLGLAQKKAKLDALYLVVHKSRSFLFEILVVSVKRSSYVIIVKHFLSN